MWGFNLIRILELVSLLLWLSDSIRPLKMWTLLKFPDDYIYTPAKLSGRGLWFPFDEYILRNNAICASEGAELPPKILPFKAVEASLKNFDSFKLGGCRLLTRSHSRKNQSFSYFRCDFKISAIPLFFSGVLSLDWRSYSGLQDIILCPINIRILGRSCTGHWPVSSCMRSNTNPSLRSSTHTLFRFTVDRLNYSIVSSLLIVLVVHMLACRRLGPPTGLGLYIDATWTCTGSESIFS